MKRSERCKWGFTSKDEAKLRKSLRGCKNVNLLRPIGVDIRLGKGLPNDWEQAENWLKDEIEKLGHKLSVYFKPNDLSFLPRSKRKLGLGFSVVKLDFETFRNPLGGLSSKEVLSNRPIRPGLEIAYFLALNPQIFTKMDGTEIPYLQAPGLVVYGTGMPLFYHDDDEHFYIMPSWHDANNCSKYTSMAAYN
jgi:hypothetical protein